MGDISKLPKWAREEFARMKNRMEAAEHRAASAFAEATTAIEVDTHRRHNDARPRCFLPEHANVEFTLANGDKVEVSLRDGHVQIWGHHSDGDFAIVPSSNIATVRFAPKKTGGGR